MGAAGDMTMATGNYAPFEIGRIAKARCPDKVVVQYVILRIPRSHCRRVAFDRRRNGLLFLELLRSPCCAIPFGRVYLRLAVMRYYAPIICGLVGTAYRHFSEHKIKRESNAFWNMRKNKLKPIESLALMDVKVSGDLLRVGSANAARCMDCG